MRFFLVVFLLFPLVHTGINGLLEPLARTALEATGDVFIEDERTLRIDNFSFSGAEGDASFYVGEWGDPGSDDYGVKVDYPENQPEATLGPFHKESVILKIPKSMSTFHLRWISVWSPNKSVDYGHAYLGEGKPHPVQTPPPIQEYQEDDSSAFENDSYPSFQEEAFKSSSSKHMVNGIFIFVQIIMKWDFF